MKKSPGRPLVATLALTAVLIADPAGATFAHEQRAGGPVELVVGWGDEPAYTGFKNSVQVTITEPGGAPVTDLGDALKVEVSKGADRITLPLEPNFGVGGFGTPGDYRAWITPTRPGTYTFRVTGTVRGQAVDQSFTSSRTTFDDVEDIGSVQFPAKDPSTGQLATRIDREIPRFRAGLREVDDRVASARTLAMSGIAVGASGILAAAAALVTARRRATTPRP